MTLEIIIPHYDEPWKVVRPFFDMLCCQRGVDFNEFRVHIVHDGVEEFPDYFYGMPYEVVQSRIEHAGVSSARNYGIDHADAKWVCFCDCDDMFTSIYSLKLVFDVLGTDDFDVLWGKFVSEDMIDGRLMMQERKEQNLVWIHNKYYRLDFLRRIGIRFEESLYYSEDSAFNAVLNLEIDQKRVGEIKSEFPLYAWCWRKDSTTTNPENGLRNMTGHFERNLYILDEMRKRNYADSAVMVARTLTDAYYYLTMKRLYPGAEELERRVSVFYRENKSELSKVTPIMISKVIAVSEKSARNMRILNEDRPPIDVWLKGLEEKYV